MLNYEVINIIYIYKCIYITNLRSSCDKCYKYNGVLNEFVFSCFILFYFFYWIKVSQLRFEVVFLLLSNPMH